MNLTFPKSRRLLKQPQFDAVYAASEFAADDVLVATARRNGLAMTRLGLSVSKKVGNAVVRNRWKRAIRESFRLQQHDLPTGIDVVVRPRKGAAPDSAAIMRSLPRLLQRLDRKLSS